MRLQLSYSLLILFTSSILNLGTQSEFKDKNALMRTWKYAKCKILQITYPAEKNEQEDRLTLNKDGSFVQVDDGETKEGIWEYLSEKKELLLHMSDSKIIDRLIVETLKNDELILRKSEPWRFDVIIYMLPENLN